MRKDKPSGRDKNRRGRSERSGPSNRSGKPPRKSGTGKSGSDETSGAPRKRSSAGSRSGKPGKPSYSGRQGADENKPRYSRDKKAPFSGEKKSRFSGEKKSSFADDKKTRFSTGNTRFSDDKKSKYSDDKKARFSDEKKPRFSGERKSRFGDDKPSRFSEGKNPRYKDDSKSRFSDEKKPRFSDDKKTSSFGERKPRYSQDSKGRSSGGGKPPFSSRKRSDSGAEERTSSEKNFRSSAKKAFAKDKDAPYDSRKRKRTSDDNRGRFSQEEAPVQTEKMRLNRFIANSGVCSRREADELITMGVISVNGTTITELGYKVNPGDEVRYEKKLLKAEKPVYILMNKPKGFLTTTNDPQERNTVMHLIGGKVKERIYPVGRLDRNTTGLLLLTNDGDLADKLMHPSYNVKKIYKVELDRPLNRPDLQKIIDGIQLEEGKAMVDDIAIVSDDGRTVGLELHIGWNRVVRRIFEALEYEVLKLDRSVYAGLDKRDLPRGEWRHLKKEEIIRLKHYK
jgi:23S rRNA pseudouridine2605 synthase